jgi:AAA+ ATPase superfamily predicted ATPase
LFDRDNEWAQLTGLVDSAAPGMRVGIVSGRRRQGKSYLLRRLTRSAGGLYHQAQELERTQALDRFANDVARTLGLPDGQLRFTDWEAAFRTALGYPARGGTDGGGHSLPAGPNRLLVLDELPYLLTHSPEIPSVLQELHDEARDAGLPSAVVIACGSSLSVMTELLSGTKPLRGRAQLDLTVRPFDYRTAAAYWGVTDPHLAFHTHTVFGGTAGYRALVDAPPTTDADFPAWISRNVLNPARALYGEKDYLLREDTRIADKQLYNSILASVAAGNHTLKAIGAPVGRDTNALRHPLSTLVASGFLIRVEDMLTPRRPLHFLADPIVRFAEVVIEPYRPLLEEGDAATAWAHAYPAYSSAVLGPHFEHLARSWTAHHSGDRWGGVQVGEVGPGLVNDPDGKTQHELDVVAVPSGVRPTPKAPLLVLGEAKSTNKARTPADLARLDGIRDLLGSQGRDAGRAQLALFSLEGFVPELVRAAAAREDVHLVDLAELYA